MKRRLMKTPWQGFPPFSPVNPFPSNCPRQAGGLGCKGMEKEKEQHEKEKQLTKVWNKHQ